MSKEHKNVMSLLKKVPGVEQHLNSFNIIKGKQILKKRMELGLTQKEICEIVNKKGYCLTPSTLMKIESGYKDIPNNTYDQILKLVGDL